ncbi:MAG: universal stress protein [Gemmatimonadetes bacterium]|uniref:Universal stress protein n=1 Tax=Candidatus Kutchimonas denitrificans TaxID=3056748 RepID=A0AAE4Z9U0_9BACT|nr:universal stress protein [Gemmatimonadota bacterium]NIR74796.1 universal stress protein [Candidatus Kutchimonas denitrificans]NIR99907.1 universal stress protein [Gemmatimonadota bacterium]NIT65491.1 universal stress protein [Gemmatimonadota bacterium]NIU52461.1 universal stress protein [Gemmatimonadota bacterium]
MNKILAATDGSEHGLAAVVTGAGCAERLGGTLELVTVVEVLLLPPAYAPPGLEPSDFEPDIVTDARARVEEQAKQAGVEGATVHVRSGFAAPLIARTAEEEGADLLVVGAYQEPSIARTLVGSTAERVLRLAHVPVLVASQPRDGAFRRVLAAIDLSRQSRQVLETARAIAEADHADLRVLYVLEPLPMMLLEAAVYNESEHRRHAREQMESILEDAGLMSGTAVEARMREGESGHEILEETQDWDADLIVMGTHGFGFFDRLLVGSTSLYVLRHGHRATLIVPPPAREE